MDAIKKGLFVISLVILMCITCDAKILNKDGFDDVKSALREYITTGVKSESIENTLKANQLPYLLREEEEDNFDNVQVCTLCNLVIDLFIGERLLGADRDFFIEEAGFICTTLGIESERVCQGVIELNVDIFLYIFDNFPNISSHRVCGSVLQSMDCETGGDFDWTINLAPPQEKSLKKSSDVKEGATFNILQLSDIHYDPLYKAGGNAKCGEPICCQEDQGDPESEEDSCGYWTDYRSADAPWHLIEESVRHSKTQDFDYVYYTGDIISHRVWETSKVTNSRDIEKLYSYFKDNFDVPIYPIFGNHEPHPLNVWTAEGVASEDLSIKWLFELAAEQWSSLIGQDVTETALKGGYYSVSPREGFRIIGLNGNLCYTVNWWLIYNDIDPFGQLQWLADTLKMAEDNNEKVHILSHVPTGSKSCLKVWGREYRRIVERFSDTITGQFNGHTHKDEFHVYYSSVNTTEPVGVAFNGASVTPFSNSNPSYKLYNVDDTNFSLKDYEEWTFNLTLANSKPSESPEWYKLYSFTESYKVEDLSATEVNKVLYAMTEDNTLLDNYFHYHYRNGDAGIKGGCDSSCQKDFLCSIATSQYGDNTQCNYFVDLYEQNS